MIFGVGKILAIRTDRGTGRATMTAQVQLPETGEVRDDTPILSVYGLTSRPRPGADAAVAFLGGNRGAGVVIATSDGRFSVQLADGEVALHTHEGAKVHLRQGGAVEIVAPGGLTITAPSLTHNGRNIGGTHRHSGVDPGGGTSGEPIG
jgi:phage gp45-like